MKNRLKIIQALLIQLIVLDVFSSSAFSVDVIHVGELTSFTGSLQINGDGPAGAPVSDNRPWSNAQESSGVYIEPTQKSAFGVGRIQLKDLTANVILGTRSYKPDPKGWVEFEVPLSKPETPFEMQVVSIKGDVQPINGVIKVTEFDQIFKKKPKNFSANLSVGPTYVVFQQPGISSFTQMALTVKGGLNYRLPGKGFDLGISGYVNAVPALLSNPDYIQMGGLNFRVGYLLPIKLTKWKFKIQGGYYYFTTLTASRTFGFKNFGAPQIYPQAQFFLTPEKVFTLYGKYAPLLGLATLVAGSNYEAALGLSYSLPLGKNLFLAAAFDVSYLQFQELTRQLLLSTYSGSIGCSYIF